ncbi:MAG: glycosyltransferase family 2 protein [Fimbriiglobus sp.]
MDLRLSIVIPSYCRADLLAGCLASLRGVSAEVLVVDDASVGGVISKTAASFGVQVLRLEQRQGFCGAVNAGIDATTGNVIELLNDDATVQPGWATAAMRHFANPRIAAVSPCVLRPDGTIDTAGDEYDPGGFAWKRGHGQAWDANRWPAGPVWGVSGVAGFFRRSALLQVGKLPADFGAYFEDVDLAHRLRAAGYEAWFEPESRVTHHLSSSYGRKPSRRTLERQSCNEERVFWRNTPRRELVRCLPRHLAVLVGKACRRQAEGTLAPWLTGRIRGMLAEGGIL